jgi:membrane-bound metal-dependent hydrolase YbcI (DUF457 family)
VPSPAGHLIAGVAVAWAAEAFALRRPRVLDAGRPFAAAPIVTPLVLACAALALAPDLDILLASHRTYTHSLGAVALVAAFSAAVARGLGAPAVAIGLACGAAVASHIALDWLGHDTSTPRGLMALWPVSSAYFYSGIDLFADVSRRYWRPEEFILKNAVSVARELLILVPIAALAFWFRQRRRERRSGMQRRSVPPEPRTPPLDVARGGPEPAEGPSPESRTQ